MAGYSSYDWVHKRLDDWEGKCPRCGLLIRVGFDNCKHCGHAISQQEMNALFEQGEAYCKQYNRSVRLGIVFMPVILLALTFLLSKY